MTTPDLRAYADALALAIEHGLADSQEAREWASSLVTELPESSAELIDLAGAIRPHPLDVVSMLRRLPGSSDPLRVSRLFFGRARAFLQARPEALAVVTAGLERAVHAGYIPEQLAGPCLAFDDERLLAEEGTYGSTSEVHAEVVAFLDVESDLDTASRETARYLRDRS